MPQMKGDPFAQIRDNVTNEWLSFISPKAAELISTHDRIALIGAISEHVKQVVEHGADRRSEDEAKAWHKANPPPTRTTY